MAKYEPPVSCILGVLILGKAFEGRVWIVLLKHCIFMRAGGHIDALDGVGRLDNGWQGTARVSCRVS